MQYVKSKYQYKLSFKHMLKQYYILYIHTRTYKYQYELKISSEMMPLYFPQGESAPWPWMSYDRVPFWFRWEGHFRERVIEGGSNNERMQKS